MAKVLVVIAHPSTSKESRTLTLLERFLAAYQQTHIGDEIVRRNVSESMPFPFNATALSVFNKRISGEQFSDEERRFDEQRAVWVQEFVDADKYVFANPMYNLFLPAEMKSYFDIVMQVHATFVYTAQGISKGLLRDKKALYLQANGGSYHKAGSAPDSSALDIGDRYIRTILTVMGVTDYTVVFAEGMDHDPEHAEEIAEPAYRQAEELAARFWVGCRIALGL